MKHNLSVAGGEFHFLLECSAYTGYHTKFVPRKLLKPPSVYHVCRFKSSMKRRTYFNCVKMCIGSNNYVKLQTTAKDRYYSMNILLV